MTADQHEMITALAIVFFSIAVFRMMLWYWDRYRHDR